MPKKILDAPEESPLLVTPHAPAGSVTLFTEALTHGPAGWNGAHERRALVYKYCVSHTAWMPTRLQMPSGITLTPRQRILFRGPADPYRHFPSLFEGFEEKK